MSKTFCPLPWISVAMRNNGDLRVCCHSNTSPGRGVARKSDQSCYNARSDSFEAFRNTPLLKSIRKSMLQGEWHENCIRCRKESEAGVRSRIDYERQLREGIVTFEKAQVATADDGTLDTEIMPLALLDVRFGNQCNLGCRTCNPSESNFWYRDHVELYGNQFQYGDVSLTLQKLDNGKVHLNDSFFDWYESQTFTESLPQLLKNISQIYIAGGEPLKTRAHENFIQKIVDLGFESQISLEYNTNGYIIPEKMWALWSNFKEVKIGLSIDSVGPMNDYIRFPSRWSLLEKNFQKLDGMGDNFVIWLCLTVHCYNIYYLPELIEWRIRSGFQKINNFKENMVFSDHPLHSPRHLNIQILPAEVKRAVISKFESFKKKLPLLVLDNAFMSEAPDEACSQICKFLDGYVNFMNQEDLSSSFSKFVKYTENLDRIRNESFADIFPGWAEILRFPVAMDGAKPLEGAEVELRGK